MKSRIETFEAFLAQDPGDSFSRYALALELAKAGREAEAERHLKEALDRDSTFVAVYYQLGRLLAKSGKIDEARDIYRRGMDAAAAAGDQRTRAELQEALDSLD